VVPPAVGTPSTTPAFIVVNTPTAVTVTASVAGSGLIGNSVNLLRLGASGTQPTILGVMQSTVGGIYSIQKSFDETASGQVQLEVSAAFRGTLLRMLSGPISIPVWNATKDSVTNTVIAYPPGWTTTQEQPTQTDLYSPTSVALIAGGDVEHPPDVTITFVNNTTGLSVNAFIAQYGGGSFESYKQITPTTISGHQAVIADDTSDSIPSQPQLAAFVLLPSQVLVITCPGDSSANFNSILSALQIP
jgi:hypothetical protein